MAIGEFEKVNQQRLRQMASISTSADSSIKHRSAAAREAQRRTNRSGHSKPNGNASLAVELVRVRVVVAGPVTLDTFSGATSRVFWGVLLPLTEPSSSV